MTGPLRFMSSLAICALGVARIEPRPSIASAWRSVDGRPHLFSVMEPYSRPCRDDTVAFPAEATSHKRRNDKLVRRR